MLVKFKLIFRLLLIDSVWNFRRHQNIGFLYTLLPILKKYYLYKEELTSAMKRHNKYINTNPIFISFIVGVVIKMEEIYKAQKNEETLKKLINLKNNLMAPLAVVGDNFLFSSLMPFLLFIGVASVTVFSNLSFKITVLISIWLFYNTLHIWLLIYGISIGYEKGSKILDYFSKLPFQYVMENIKICGIIIIILFSFVIFPYEKIEILSINIFTCFISISLVVFFDFIMRLKVSTTVLYFVLLSGCILISYIFPIEELLIVR